MERNLAILTVVHPKDFIYLNFLYSSLLRQDVNFSWIILVDGFHKPNINVSDLKNVDIIFFHKDGKRVPINGPRYPYLLKLGLKYVRHMYETEWMAIIDSDVYLSRNYLASSINSSYDLTVGKLYEFRGDKLVLIRTKYDEIPYSGAALIFRRDVYDALTIYPYDGIDYVFIVSAILRGFRVGINKDAFYIHLRPQVGWKRHFAFGCTYAKSGYHPLYIIGKALTTNYRYFLPFIAGAIYGYCSANYFPKEVYRFNRSYSLNIIKNIFVDRISTKNE